MLSSILLFYYLILYSSRNIYYKNFTQIIGLGKLETVTNHNNRFEKLININ